MDKSRHSDSRRAKVPAGRKNRRVLAMEILEKRLLRAMFPVTTSADSGDGSLRSEIALANADPAANGADIIEASSSSLGTIYLLSTLPPVTRPDVTVEGLNIDGSKISSSNGPGAYNGLTIQGAGDAVTDLSVSGFSGTGILVMAGSVQITQSQIVSNGADGVDVKGSSAVVSGNLISGNQGNGLTVSGSYALIVGNIVGLDAAGSAADANSGSGVVLSGGTGNTIGSPVAGGGNVIGGNGQVGIEINGSSNNLMINNIIGTSADLSVALGNGVNGINVENGSSSNTIGGTGPDDGNRIVCTDPGFSAIGIGNDGDGSNGNLIQGNTINLSADGNSSLGDGNGIYIGSDHNTVGGTTAAARNFVVGASGFTAIWLNSSGSFDNLIEGNYLGTTVDGSASAAGGQGRAIDSAHDNTIGGYAAGAGNVISGNRGPGIDFQNATGNVVAGNLIGTDATGSAPVPNQGGGIVLEQASSNNTIGGSVAGSGNVIAGNDGFGVIDRAHGTASNYLTGNHIGGNASTSGALNSAGGGFAASSDAALSIGSASVISGGILVAEGAVVAVHGSGDHFSGKLVIESNQGLKVSGSSNVFSGGVTAKSGGPLNVFGRNNRISGGILISGGNITVSGGDNSVSGSLELDGSGLLKFTGTSDRYSGSAQEDGDAAVQISGKDNAMYGSLAINGGASLALGSNVLLAGVVTVSESGHVDITGSDDRIAGGIVLDDSKAFTVAGSGNAVSGFLTDAGGAPIHVAGTLFVTGGVLTLESDSVISGSLTVNKRGAVNVSGANNVVSAHVGGGANGSGNRTSGSGSSAGGGSLKVSGSSNALSGSLLLKAGVITISGTGAALTVSGPTTLSGASFGAGAVLSAQDGGMFTANGSVNLSRGGISASAGGTVSLPGLTAIDRPELSFSADGPGSEIDLSNLTSIAGASGVGFSADGAGSEINLPKLTTVSGGLKDSIGVNEGASVLAPALTTISSTIVDAAGSGSRINLSALTAFNGGALRVTSNATVLNDGLTVLNGVAVTLDGTGTIQTSQWTTLTNGALTIDGGDYSSTTTPPFASLNNIDGSNVSVGGGSLALPAVTTMSIDPNLYGPTELEVGYGDRLSLPNLTGISGGNPVTIAASGTGGEIDLPELTSIVLDTNDGDFSDTGGGTIEDPNLTSLSGVRVTLDGTGTVQTSQWQTLTNGGLAIDGGDYSSTTSPPFASLSNINGSSVSVEDGGRLTLPALITFANANSYAFSSPLMASGADSALSLPDLTSVSVSGFDTSVGIEALQGGHVLLPSLGQINISSQYSGELGVTVESQGSGSLIDLSSLTSFSGAATGASLTITNGGTVLDPDLMTFSDVTITTDSTGMFTVPAGETFSFPSGTTTINTGTVLDQGTSSVQGSAAVEINGGLTINGQGALSTSANSTLDVSGSLLGNTTNAAGWSVAGTVAFDGTGTASSPQLLEAMSEDMGNVTAGYTSNFDFGTLKLTANSYVELVDQFANSSGNAPNAVYVNTLIVPSGATLNLDGLHLYAVNTTIAGTITGGVISQIATDDWVSTASGNWNVGSNWSTGAVPTSNEAVIINVPGASPTVTISSGAYSVYSIAASDPLSITGGALTVAANSTIGDGLSMTGGSLIASGAGAMFTVAGAVAVSSASLYAQGGATLAIPGLTSYSAPGFATLEATGSGSVLELSGLTSITDGSFPDTVAAMNGGTVELNSLATLAANLTVEAENSGSKINLPDFKSFSIGSGFAGGGANLLAENGAAIVCAQLETLNSVSLTESDTASISLGSVTNIDESSVTAENGATVSLPGVTSYSSSGATLDASGANSVLNLSTLSTVSDTGYQTDIESLAGGTVNLNQLSTLVANVALESESSGSTLNIPDLTSFTVGSAFAVGGATLLAENGATVSSPQLATLNGVSLILSDTATINLKSISKIDNSSVTAENGATVSLPGVTSYSSSGATLEASGANSVLNLSTLSTVSDTGYQTDIESLAGGTVNLNQLSTLVANVALESESSGSTLNIPDLTSFTVGSAFAVGGATLLAENGATVSSPQLATLSSVSLIITGGGTLSDPDLSTFINSTITTDPAGTFSVPANETFTFPSGTTTINTGTVLVQGTMNLEGSAIVNISGGLTINGQGALSTSSASTLNVSGSLLGNTTSVAGFNSQGSVVLDGSGTSSSPQLLEAMSEDLGNVASGYNNNFAYGTLKLGSNTYVKLVDESANSPGSSPNALYVNTLIVPSGATLNLNGLHLYALHTMIAGTIAGGVISPATVDWVSTASGNWNVGSNWSTGTVPTSNEEVIINVPGATPTITISSGSDSVYSIAASDPLSITGGSLTVTSASTISGGLSMTGGSLVASGPGTLLTVTGTTTVSAASLYAEGGATLNLPNLLSYNGGTSTNTLEATGAGSVLDLPGVTTWEGVGNCCSQTNFSALAGGEVSLPALTTDQGGATQFLAQGTGSIINLPELTSLISDQGSNQSTLQATQGGQVVSPDVTTLGDVVLTIDGTGTQNTAQIVSLNSDATLFVSGGSPSFADLTTIDGSNVTVSGGITLTLAGLTEYTGSNVFYTVLQATGAGSVLNLPNVSKWEGSAGCCAAAELSAFSGGEITLPKLTTNPGGETRILAQGSGSIINLPVLTSLISDQGSNATTLSITQGGQVVSPDMTTLYDVSLTIDGTGTQNTAQIVSMLGDSTLDVSGGSPSFAGLTTIDGSNITVSGGATLTLAGLTEYTGGNGYYTTIEATGAGSVLNLPKVTRWEGSESCCSAAELNALAGGEISLPALTTDQGGEFRIMAQGTGSIINFPVLTSLISDQGSNATTLSITQGGQVGSPDMTTLYDVSLTIDGTGSQNTAQIVSMLGDSTLNVSGGSPNFAGLTTIDGSNVTVSGGVNLTLPGLTEYVAGNTYYTTLEATGAGSVLNLPKVTTYEGSVTCCAAAELNALSGGEISLPTLTTDQGGETRILAQGSGSSINLPELTSLISDQGSNQTTLQTTQGGTVTDPDLTSLFDVVITTDATGTFSVPANQTISIPGSTTTINTGAVLDQGALSLQSSAVLKINGGLTINGQGGLSMSSNSTLDVSGNLVGNTTDAAAFNPSGTVILDGAQGTSNPPQQLEAMSQDLGNVAAGFSSNFAYNTLELTANTYAELVDNSANAPGGAANAIYVNTLIVPAGATLNLNGIHLYAQTKQISGTITGGVVSPQTVEWVSTTSGDWNTGSNWSTGAVPTSNENVIIDVPGATPTITISSGTQSVLSITAGDPLSITGGSLIVAADSTIGGGLTMTGGSLEANGSGVSLTVTGTTTVSRANLYAIGGATLSLPGLTSYTGGGDTTTSTLQAAGTGSLLSLPNLASIAGIFASNSSVQVGPSSGGDVELPLLTQSTGPVVLASASGSGTLDVAELSTFTSGTISDSGGTLGLPSLSNASSTTFQISGGVTMSLPTVTKADYANFKVSGGASLTLAGLTGYTGGSDSTTSTVQASGTGSLLSFPNLATITAIAASDSFVQIGTSSGGDVELPLLTTMTGPAVLSSASGSGTLDVADLSTFTGGTISDAGGTLSLPSLSSAGSTTFQISGGTSMSLPLVTSADYANFEVSGGASLTLAGLMSYTGGGGDHTSTLQASGTGSRLSLPKLATFTGISASDSSVDVYALSTGDVELPLLTQGTGPVGLMSTSGSTLNAAELSTFTGGTISDSGGTFNLASLTNAGSTTFQISGGAALSLPLVTNADYANFEVSGGASLTLAILSSYAGGGGFASTTLQASGTGSLLSLPDLATLTASTAFDSSVPINALASGDVELPLLTQMTGPAVLSSTTGSTLDAAKLSTFTGGTISDSGGTIDLSSLANAGSTTFQISGGVKMSLPTLTQGDYATFEVSSGASLTLAGLLSYTGGGGFASSTLHATGTDSLLSLPKLQTLSASTAFDSSVQVDALSSGDVELPLVTQISGPVSLESNGTGSVLNLSDLPSLTGNGEAESLTVTQGGTVTDPDLTTFANVTITMDPTATFTVPANETFTFPNSTTTIKTGTVLDQGDLNLQSSAVLNINGGLTINGQGGLSTSSSSALEVSGNLLGTTINAAAFNPLGPVILDSATGTSNSPQLLEAMSQDLGNVAAGYNSNFAYSTLELSANTYAELVDNSANAPGGAPNAIYVNTLIVPSGATLNLNGLHLYAQTKQISGTITGGVVSPTTVEWTSTTSGNWNVGSNWSTGVIPTSSQAVIINVPGATPTITISSGAFSVLLITASDPLSITGGSLTVGANSTIGGGLSMTGGSLESSGSGVSLTVTGPTSVSGASLYALSGSTLTLLNMTSYVGGANYPTTLQASGAGSVLNLSNVTTWEGEFNGGNVAQISALSGGEVLLAGVTTDEGGLTDVLAQGNGSIVDLSALTNLIVTASGGRIGALQATQGGRIKSPSLTTLNDVNLTIDGTGTQDTAQITSFVGATIAVSGGSPSFADLSDLNGASIVVSGGISITLPALASYTGAVNYDTYLQATGSGTELSLPELASITGEGGDCCSSTQVGALAGGDVALSGLTAISGPAVWVESDGTGSTVDAPLLVNFQGTTGKAYTSGFQASNGGTLRLPVLASCTEGTITVQLASLSLPDLSDIDDSSVLVAPGTQLTLPMVASYTGSVNHTTNIQVTGPNSLLSLPDLASVTGGAGDCCSSTQFPEGTRGEQDLELPALAKISGPSVSVESDGTGSKLDAPALESFTGDGDINHLSALQATNTGTVIDPELTTLNTVKLITDPTAAFSLPASQTFSFTGGTNIVQAGAFLVQGTLNVQTSATLDVEGGLTVNGQGGLSTSSNSTLEVSGNLVGNTTNAAGFAALGAVILDGSGTSSSPQLLEAMSQDLGNVAAGYSNNFAYNTLELTANTYVELVDNGANSPGGTPEAVYVNDLIVPSGASLNLNGLHLYAVHSTIAGTIIDGVVSPTTVEWTSTTSGDWNVGSNWSTGAVPTSNQNVIIDVLGATPTITISSGTQSVLSITASDPLSITGGSLTVAASSTIGGGLSMTGGSLVANGSGASLTVTGTTTLAGASLYAEGGASLILTSLNSYTQPNFDTGSTFEATGTGSLLSLPNLVSLAATSSNTAITIDAFAGGDVELPQLTQLTGGVNLETNSATSVLNVSQLTTFTSGTLIYGGGTLSYSGGTTNLPALVDVDDSLLVINGGVSLSPSTVTAADGTSFNVSGGASLTLSGLKSYAQPNFDTGSTLQASGTGSLLSLPNLGSIATTGSDASITIEALAGGDVEIPLVTQLTGGVTLEANSATSVLNVSQLTTFTNGSLIYSGGTLSYGGGTTNLPALVDVDDSLLVINGGVSLSLSTVTAADGTSFNVSGGASLTLSGLKSYAQPSFDTGSNLQASGTGSLLSFPNLGSIAATGSNASITLEALAGGDVEIPLVTQLTDGVSLEANSATSVLNVSQLTTFTNGTLIYSGGTLSYGGGTTNLPALVDVDDSFLDISGGASLSVSTVTAALGANISVSGGASLTLSGLKSYAQPNVDTDATLQVSGTGSLLSLPNLGSIAATGSNASITIEALAGGDVEIPLVTQLTGSVLLESTGTGSMLDLSALQSLTGIGGSLSLTYTQGGSVADPNLTTFANATITTDPTATFTVPANQTFSFLSSTTTINTGTVLDQGTVSLQGSAEVEINGGLTLSGQGSLSSSSSSTLDVSGNLAGNTTNAAAFSSQGTVILDSSQGTGNPPQLLEAMSQDLGDVAAGYHSNFAYSTLELTANTYVELVDNAANSPGNTPEAVYVGKLIVPAGATLNLDGLQVYAQTEQINGTIVNGGAVVSGEVYDDLNDDGALDNGDPGLSGWTVELTNTSNNAVYTATTNSSGLYSLIGVAAGTYTLSEVVQSGFVQTAPASPGTFTITVASGQTVSNENFGAYQPQTGPTVYMVTSNADSAPTSLREAIAAADLHGSASTIDITIGTGGQTIDLLSALPAITAPVTIDANA